MHRTYVITTLAEYQTRFWALVGHQLKRLGHDIAFVSFDDRSTEMLERDGFAVYSAVVAARDLTADRAALVIERLEIGDMNYWLTHERFAFGLRDGAAMRIKLAAAALATEEALTRSNAMGNAVLVQELGGFLSVIGSFFAAKAQGIENWFIEPSFFRGRLLFLRDSFAALRVDPAAEATIPPALQAYLEETKASRAIVIPEKDRHQYTSAPKKIINLRNARRLIEKVADKYLFGKKQEFGHIGHHVTAHAKMLFNSYRLRNRYTALEDVGRFIYYPLHVPGDMALTLRSPRYLDQIALIDYICRTVPSTHKVAIKEHPAMVGAVDADKLRELLQRYDNLVLLPPTTNNYAVLAKADLVVSVNSKSGAEAGLMGLAVVVLGDAFYRTAPFAVPVEDLGGLGEAMHEALARPHPDEADVVNFFGTVWANSYPGELYVANADNAQRFAATMTEAIA
jgi:hypothetical protein